MPKSVRATVKDHTLMARGRKIRKATMVTFANGQVVKFMEKLPVKKAVEQAVSALAKAAR